MSDSRRPKILVLAVGALLLAATWGITHLLAQEAVTTAPPPPSADSLADAESGVLEYDRGTFRDPFRSLREPKIEDDGPRPEGPPGMLIQEIDVVGVLAGPRGAMVLILGSDGLGYSLTEGSKLYDGVTLRIDPREGKVVFRQDVNDPNRIKPYRDIERQLDSGS